MQKEEVIFLKKFDYVFDGVKNSKICLIYDGIHVVSFDVDDEFRARFVACNLWFAVHRVIKNTEDIKLYE